MKNKEKLSLELVDMIIDNLKIYFKVSTLAELGHSLGITQSTLSTWRRRGNVDFSLIIAKCHGVSIDFLLTGIKPEYIRTGENSKELRSNDVNESKTISRKSNEFDLEKEFEKIRKQMEELQERVTRSERQPEESPRAGKRVSYYDRTINSDELMLKPKKKTVK